MDKAERAVVVLLLSMKETNENTSLAPHHRHKNTSWRFKGRLIATSARRLPVAESAKG
ncbi:hypothetical protein THH46_08880 [Pseudomonas sp. NA13]